MTRDAAPEAVGREARVADLLYAAVAVVAGLPTILVSAFTSVSPGSAWPVVALVLLAVLPSVLVAIRRAPPLPVYAVLSLAPVAGVVLLVGLDTSIFITTAAASRVASRSDSRRFVAATTALAMLIPFLVLFHPTYRELGVLAGAVYFAFGDVFGVLVGVLLRRTTRLSAELRRADARLAEARVREDRTALARDVHDLVAHSLTVVVLHVGGARRVLRADPDAAERALTDAERVCRESLDGIRGVVGLLRADGEDASPALDLAELARTYREAGVAVDLHVEGDPGALPLLVRRTALRVAQESLANAARYADRRAPVALSFDVEADAVTVRIENATRPLAPTAASDARSAGGYGLVGLREQVTALGGRLDGGPEGDRWVVTCRLPLARDTETMTAAAVTVAARRQDARA